MWEPHFMWTYSRCLSLTNRYTTVVCRGYAFKLDPNGVLLSDPTPEMLNILQSNPAWTYTALATDVGSTDVGSADVGSADVGSADVGSADVGSADVKKKRGRPAKRGV